MKIPAVNNASTEMPIPTGSHNFFGLCFGNGGRISIAGFRTTSLMGVISRTTSRVAIPPGMVTYILRFVAGFDEVAGCVTFTVVFVSIVPAPLSEVSIKALSADLAATAVAVTAGFL